MNKEELRAARVSLGMDRTTLAAYLGVSFWTVAQWESGRRPIGMEPFLLRIALSEAAKAQAAGMPLPNWRALLHGPDISLLTGSDDSAVQEGAGQGHAGLLVPVESEGQGE